MLFIFIIKARLSALSVWLYLNTPPGLCLQVFYNFSLNIKNTQYQLFQLVQENYKKVIVFLHLHFTGPIAWFNSIVNSKKIQSSCLPEWPGCLTALNFQLSKYSLSKSYMYSLQRHHVGSETVWALSELITSLQLLIDCGKVCTHGSRIPYYFAD